VSIDQDFLLEDLIESIKDRSFAPTSQTTFSDEKITTLANDELLRVMAAIIAKREDFFLATHSQALVAGQASYLIPKSAAGNALHALFLVDAGGNRTELQRRDISRKADYAPTNGDTDKFYFQGDEIVLMRAPATSSGTLECVYNRRPNRLIATSSCAKITSVTSPSTDAVFAVNTDLTGSLSVGSKVDFLRSTSPYQLWAEEIEITAIDASSISVALEDVQDISGNVEPGALDYICPTGYANIPMLPIEFHSVLAERVAARQLRALRDLQKWQASVAEARAMQDEAMALIKNRAASAPERPSKKRGLLFQFRG
jgi:hypothetical protein